MDTRIIPQHIAIIMDGNGRWAKKRGLPRTAGHKQGAENIKKNRHRMQYDGSESTDLLCVFHGELETSAG